MLTITIFGNCSLVSVTFDEAGRITHKQHTHLHHSSDDTEPTPAAPGDSEQHPNPL